MANIVGDDGPNVRDDTAGDDSLYGLSGNDVLRVSSGIDYVNGGFDEDTVVLKWSDAQGFIYVGTGYAFVDTSPEHTYATATRKVSFEQYEHLDVQGGVFNDTINGIAGASDVINGGDGIDTWSDNFAGFTGDLKVIMSDGGGALADGSAIGNMEIASFLDLGEGNDIFRDYDRFGGSFDDIVFGRGGDDYMVTFAGRDALNGGSGFDTIAVNWVNRTENTYFTALGGYGFANTGADQNYATSLREVGFEQFERLDFTGGLGNDTVVGFANVADRINGDGGVDRWIDEFGAFTGDLAVDLTQQGPDRPLADGSVYYGLESVELAFGSGNDSFRDFSVGPFVQGDFDDIITSRDGNDDLSTSSGRDTFYAGDGFDTVRINWQSAQRTMFVDAPAGYAFVYTDGATDYGTSLRRINFQNFERIEAHGSTSDDSMRGFANVADSFDGGGGTDLWIDDFSTVAQGLDIDMGKVADGFEGLTLADGTHVFSMDRVQLVLGTGNDQFRDKRWFDDTVQGLGGNDTFATEGGRDVFDGGDGRDTLAIDWSNSFATNTFNGLTGRAFVGGSFDTSTRRVEFSSIEGLTVKAGVRHDLIVGTNGKDTLDGSAGYDTVDYSSETASVVVTLKFASFAQVKIGGFVEDRLKDIEYIIGGSGNDRLTGDTDSNAFTGGGGNDVLDGGAGGTDLLRGGTGNDVYFIRSIGDRAVEKDGEGIDTVRSFISHALGSYVEKLVLSGASNINGTGNRLDNAILGNGADNVLFGLAGNDRIFGRGGADRIDGGKGADMLTGGAGKDQFVFALKPGPGNVDTIADFSVPQDTIRIENAFFTGLTAGTLAATAFKNIASGTVDASDRILYDADTGDLFFDRDGSRAAFSAVKFAELANAAKLTNADFLIV